MSDIDSKTCKELITLCKERGITGTHGKKKSELFEMLNSAQTAALSNRFVYQTMLTCIGNKRKLVTNIRNIIDELRIQLAKPKLNIVDGFAGSSVVSRELTYVADRLYTNDLELYSYIMAYCYLVKPSTVAEKAAIRSHIDTMNRLAESGPYKEGIICRLYASKDTMNVKQGERCFYTRENALIIDTLRSYIEDSVEPTLKYYCLAPLLNKASIHTNTAGVFKGFYKNAEGIGQFGGEGRNALERIMQPIRIDMPIWNEECTYSPTVFNEDINELVGRLPDDIDVMYLDPPYNQHPYGSNYFMLNVIAENREQTDISTVSGIPKAWNKSAYNSRRTAIESMKNLLAHGLTKSKFVLLSYNNEGIIQSEDWVEIFAPYTVKKYEIRYDTYKGSRNIKNRENKVTEIMYLISKRS